ncbi:MAG: DNA-3-methyladenine glycosylase 2 family protein [Chloroflexi bacterium]|nr:DNA-3-methyladenine glycosylase 2 family protein [Chloroflexota bacterium]
MAARVRFSLARAYAHLRSVDPVVAALIDEHGPYRPRPSEGTSPADYYNALQRTILFQQLAGPAARSIQRKWFALYSKQDRPPTPKEVLKTTDEQFRASGVSRQKAGYLRDLAAKAIDKTLDFNDLETMSDDEIVERITAVKGLGEWSAHMFMMFTLGRPDVLAVGDLGIRNGMKIAYGLPQTPTPKEALTIGAPWAPYRSVGAWYMYRAIDTQDPD